MLAAPQSAEYAQHARTAQEAIRANNPSVAERELKALLKIAPSDANVYANLGMVEFSQAQYANAAREFETALSHAPALWSAQAFLGMCRIRLGATEEGQKLIADSLAHVADRKLHSDAGLDLVRSYSETAKLEKAAEILQQLHASDPANQEVLYTSYRLHTEIASAALRKLTAINNDSAWVHEVLGQNFMSQEQYPQAIEEFQRALERNPQLSGLHYQLAAALLSAERTPAKQAEAEKEFLAELQTNPRDTASLIKLAEISVERANLPEAQSFASRAVASQPASAEAHAILAKVLERLGDVTAATTELEKAEALSPETKMTHYQLAQLYRAQGRSADSERELAAFRTLSASPR